MWPGKEHLRSAHELSLQISPWAHWQQCSSHGPWRPSCLLCPPEAARWWTCGAIDPWGSAGQERSEHSKTSPPQGKPWLIPCQKSNLHKKSALVVHQSLTEYHRDMCLRNYRAWKLKMHFFCYRGHTITNLLSINKHKIKLAELNKIVKSKKCQTLCFYFLKLTGWPW